MLTTRSSQKSMYKAFRVSLSLLGTRMESERTVQPVWSYCHAAYECQSRAGHGMKEYIFPCARFIESISNSQSECCGSSHWRDVFCEFRPSAAADCLVLSCPGWSAVTKEWEDNADCEWFDREICWLLHSLNWVRFPCDFEFSQNALLRYVMFINVLWNIDHIVLNSWSFDLSFLGSAFSSIVICSPNSSVHNHISYLLCFNLPKPYLSVLAITIRWTTRSIGLRILFILSPSPNDMKSSVASHRTWFYLT
jgi:hypothetical protein